MLTPVGNSSPSPVYPWHASRFRKGAEAVAEDVAKLCSWRRRARCTATEEKDRGREIGTIENRINQIESPPKAFSDLNAVREESIKHQLFVPASPRVSCSRHAKKGNRAQIPPPDVRNTKRGKYSSTAESRDRRAFAASRFFVSSSPGGLTNL